MWNPYQLKKESLLNDSNTELIANKGNYVATSSSPESTNISVSSTNSSNNEKINQQTALSIASLIPTPSYDDDDETSQIASNHQDEYAESLNCNDIVNLNQQNNINNKFYKQQSFNQQGIYPINNQLPISASRSSLGSDSNSLANSTDVSSISATSTPTYRSPPSSFSNSSIYSNQNYNFQYSNHLNTQSYNQQQNHGYQYFNGIDFNPSYYSTFKTPDSLKLTSILKQEPPNLFNIDYSNPNNQFNSLYPNCYQNSEYPKTQFEDFKSLQTTQNVHTKKQPILNNNLTNTQSLQNNFSQVQNNIAYYNNINLNSSSTIQSPNSYFHHNQFNNDTEKVYQKYENVQTNHQQILPPKLENSNLITSSKNHIFNPNLNTSPSNVNNIGDHSSLKTNNNPNIKVKLQDMGLWKQFNNIGTEMIITKCGRRMFPSLRVSVTGLESSSKYLMVIDIIPIDDNRYKYHNCEWVVSGKAEAHFAGRGYLHPDSPLNGSQWSKQVISFHKLKLTNNPFDRAGHIILNSMHKYVPRLHIIEEGKSISTFILNEAEFTAVTAYQNEAITKLKIEYNPFAKGFRDGQSRKDFRAKRNSDDENEFTDNSFNPLPIQNKLAKNSVPNYSNKKEFQEGISTAPSVLTNKNLNLKMNQNVLQSINLHQQQNNCSNMNENMNLINYG